eukprot:8088128-Pyramimonas_sp.AAC.1
MTHDRACHAPISLTHIVTRIQRHRVERPRCGCGRAWAAPDPAGSAPSRRRSPPPAARSVPHLHLARRQPPQRVQQ